MTVAPFGSWPSPLSPAALGTGRVSVSGLQVHRGACYWSESRPAEGGRQVVMRLAEPFADASASVVSPDGVSVRTRVHEYGGGAFWACDAGLVYSAFDDGALWLLAAGGGGEDQRRLTPEPPAGEIHRYADMRTTPARASGGATGGEAAPGASAYLPDLVVALRERHHADGVDDEIVALELAPGSSPTVLAAGRDFFAAPRPSPDGARLAWLCWDHPNMPWDGCELWVADLVVASGGAPALAGAVQVDGAPEVSVGQPTWAPDGALWFVSDRAGWWQPWRWEAGDAARRMCALEAEFHGPDWALGQQTMAVLGDGRLVCRFRSRGRDRVGVLRAESGRLEERPQPCVTIAALAAQDDGSALVVGATSDVPTALHALAPDGADRVLHRPGGAPALAPSWVSVAEQLSFETAGGILAHALFYPPSGPDITGPPGELPPLVVMVHGGPTGACEPGLDLWVQFWTTRGLAVAAVDYRGSSGYGRAYRSLLRGAWGVADPEDCMAAAAALADRGMVDPSRMAVRGSSAGGLTALRALQPGGPFTAASVSYGVTDLAALAADTHKFEARYLDGLVGPWPEAAATYAERSPAEHPDQVDGAVLLLQGADDPVVPPDQASRLAQALRARGLRCDHLVFPGEGHGWRRAETITRAAELELAFLGEVLGFSPAR